MGGERRGRVGCMGRTRCHVGSQRAHDHALTCVAVWPLNELCHRQPGCFFRSSFDGDDRPKRDDQKALRPRRGALAGAPTGLAACRGRRVQQVRRGGSCSWPRGGMIHFASSYATRRSHHRATSPSVGSFRSMGRRWHFVRDVVPWSTRRPARLRLTGLRHREPRAGRARKRAARRDRLRIFT